MDTGVLNRAPLNQYQFETDSVGAIPLPDELPPPPPDAHRLRLTPAHSSAVESLLTQNEDLMARLKVSLRRLNLVECENQKLAGDLDEAQRKLRFVEDQALVLREKDQAWSGKLTENERKTLMAQSQLEELAALLRASQTEVARFRKYHDRIRTQVKPHLVELKNYARSLEEKVTALQGEVERSEGRLRDLREQMAEVTKNSRREVEQAEQRVHEMIESYETTLSHQSEELHLTREKNRELEAKVSRLNRAEQRADELENEVVELRRNRESLSQRFENESRRLLEKSESTAAENIRLKLENDDLRARALSDFDRIRELEKQFLDQQAQMESLRFIYNTRMDENERMKLSLASLERLNIDLCARLQELRDSSASTSASAVAADSSN